ncbi:hypothetical protein BDQ17DRAFT_1526382 [Cyathus striatus]|nr:hypothetical protein BDQ17DRAFT_1526382 [Cyathus striatus]
MYYVISSMQPGPLSKFTDACNTFEIVSEIRGWEVPTIGAVKLSNSRLLQPEDYHILLRQKICSVCERAGSSYMADESSIEMGRAASIFWAATGNGYSKVFSLEVLSNYATHPLDGVNKKFYGCASLIDRGSYRSAPWSSDGEKFVHASSKPFGLPRSFASH